jgi:microsomal dipeptidase-like Zn-dependent dipeptidase
MDISKKYYADSLAFFALQGQPPIFELTKHPQLSLAHLTSAPPFLKDFDAALAAHKTFREQALSNPDVHEVRTAKDLELPGTGIVFGLQHAPEGMTFERVRMLAREGVRFMTLAFDGASAYGGGFLSEGGLTARGRELIEWMSQCGIILDLSHANDRTARDALDFIWLKRFPVRVAATHTGCRSIFPHPRNLSDAVLWGLTYRDGYVGITAVTFFLGGQDSSYLENVARHVAYAIRVCGGYKVGIGSDSPHIDMTMAEAEKHFGVMTKMLKTKGKFGEYFPDRPPELIEHGSRMFEVFGEVLTQSPEVLGGNFRDFLKRSLP